MCRYARFSQARSHLSLTNGKQIEEDHLKIRSIAEIIIFCGRQGIAPIGYHDDRPSVEEDPNETFWLYYSFVCNLEIKYCQII